MAFIDMLSLAHIPPSITLFGALYQDVQNAAFLREQLLTGNSDFEYAFVDAATILSTTHILAAAFRAINDMLNNRLRTRNVHAEIVFSLSPNNNIASSFTNHGISPSTTSLLVLKVSTPANPVTHTALTLHLNTYVQGTPLCLSDASLERMTDMVRVRKLYKLGGTSEVKGRGKKRRSTEGSAVNEEEVGGVGNDRREIEVMVLGMMALKGS